MDVENLSNRAPGEPELHFMKWILSPPPDHTCRHFQKHPSLRLNRSWRHKKIVWADGSCSLSGSSYNIMTLPSTHIWASWRNLLISWLKMKTKIDLCIHGFTQYAGASQRLMKGYTWFRGGLERRSQKEISPVSITGYFSFSILPRRR